MLAGILAGGLTGAVVGIVVLVLWGIAFVKIDSLNKRLARVESVATGASASAERANANVANLHNAVQSALDTIGQEFDKLNGSIQKLKAAPKTPATATKDDRAESAVADTGEYIVKPDDTGMSIAKATGISLPALVVINPGIDWNRLRVGQKIRTR